MHFPYFKLLISWENNYFSCNLFAARESLRNAKKEFSKTEDDLKSLQSVGQIIGEVLRPLDNERLIVKASSGPRYVVGCRSKVDKDKLTSGTRVVLDMTTLTIMRALPREVDPVVYNMLHEDPGNPCIIFMDEIDAIGGRRFSEGTSADREIQRTLMELLNQLDGFDQLGKVKMIMATNRPDVLDPALLRPGRLDRKIEIPLPNEQSRMEILKIHAAGIAKLGEIDYEAVVKLAEGFNGADLRNVCTEAGMSAIRAERDYVIHEDFMKVSLSIWPSSSLLGFQARERISRVIMLF
ncbi:26S protease regulatory subunit S10B like B [Dendrobium catenatum]|uniref:26S protease regulatory subunit S10B like B n=1 Tax=Dendrobium catenatum TaxID=906689 RepID=A0A2I0VS25_9ASPA|nr:26S protease regulatory subunit S10B like B [Dendrobium catenatum]